MKILPQVSPRSCGRIPILESPIAPMGMALGAFFSPFPNLWYNLGIKNDVEDDSLHAERFVR